MLAFHYRPNYSVEPYAPPTWADGTDAEIAEAVAKADAGEINLSDYWAVGDERTVSLAAMAATATGVTVGETHAAQDVTLVIMNEGYPVVGVDNSHVHFVVGLKNCLNETGYINSYNGNGTSWRGSNRRAWCNSIFYESFPDILKPIFKLFTTKTASKGNNSNPSIDALEDRFALFAEKELWNKQYWGTNVEANQLNQITWYVTESNLIKQASGTNCGWWQRTPRADVSFSFCFVDLSGYVGCNDYAAYSYGLAPFGCI